MNGKHKTPAVASPAVAAPVRVAQVIGRLSAAGVEAVVNNYCREMDPSRVRFDYFIDDDSPCEPPREMIDRGARYFRIPSSKHPVRRVCALRRLFQQNGYRIVHAHMNALNQMVLLAARGAGVPVRISHSHSTSDPAEGARALIKGALRHTGSWFATDLMACGEQAGRWLFGDRAYDAGKVTVLHNAIDLERFACDAQARRDARAELGLHGRFVVGHIGRFMRQKNHAFLIEAFAALAAQRPDALLLLAGDGALREPCERLAREKGIADSVRFLGIRGDTPRLYSAMDVFALPSLYEGLPVVGLEAQASGLPCLFSDHISREADATGDARFLPLDAKAWAQALAACASRSEEERRQASRGLAGGIYDLRACGKQLQARYEAMNKTHDLTL